jgi:hypothetical protein
MPKTGSQVTVIGYLAVVGEYEWDTFERGEFASRQAGEAVAAADHGDTMLDLGPPTNG